MAKHTEIGWTDHTWSPWWGCTKVGPACDNCYAEALDRRTGGSHWGPHAPRKMLSANHWKAPKRWNAEVPDGAARFVFPSMCDPFDNHESVAAEQVHFWELMHATPRLTWLLLTKRIGNVIDMCADLGGLPRNAALGITVVTQAEYDRDAPKLRYALAALRPAFTFASMEPLLEAIAIDDWAPDWIIVGGESGANARPMNGDWVRAIRDEAEARNRVFFFKQWGGRTPKANGKALDGVEFCARPTPGAPR